MGVDTHRLLAKIGLQLMNLILEPLKAGDKDFPGVSSYNEAARC
jgi:hypothetical protein